MKHLNPACQTPNTSPFLPSGLRAGTLLISVGTYMPSQENLTIFQCIQLKHSSSWSHNLEWDHCRQSIGFGYHKDKQASGIALLCHARPFSHAIPEQEACRDSNTNGEKKLKYQRNIANGFRKKIKSSPLLEVVLYLWTVQGASAHPKMYSATDAGTLGVCVSPEHQFSR